MGSLPDPSKGVIVWQWVNLLLNEFTLGAVKNYYLIIECILLVDNTVRVPPPFCTRYETLHKFACQGKSCTQTKAQLNEKILSSSLSHTTNFGRFEIEIACRRHFKFNEKAESSPTGYEQFFLFPQCFQKTFTADT